jgi:hypothetical protein
VTTTITTSAEEHNIFEALHRLQLAADALQYLAESVPIEEHGSAAFVVEEATEALEQIRGDMERRHTPKAKEVQS